MAFRNRLLLVTQDAKLEPKVEAKSVDVIIVAKGSEGSVKSKTRRLITRIVTSDPKVIQVSNIIRDSVEFKALSGGITRLTLTDLDDKQQIVIVIVGKKPK